MKGFLIQLSLDLLMQVLGVDAWDLLDTHTVDGLVEAILWVWFMWSILGRESQGTRVKEYYLED